MRKGGVVVVVLVLIASAGLAVYYRSGEDSPSPPATPGGEAGGRGGGGRGGFARPPMTVELAPASRANLFDRVTVVGNLIGAATVEVVPKVSGRLQEVRVRLGDPVRRGQALAQVEDREILEQVKQAEASFAVAQATIRQREADLKFAETNLERTRSLFSRQLLARQALDDADARYQAATAQLDLARAQFQQARSRLDELQINLANTVVTSPVDGFVGRRLLDPGAFVGPNSSFISVVDISLVRLVANIVERDLRRIAANLPAEVEVDAYPGEKFHGRVARVAPVLDPATRTAQMEVEVLNRDLRLKPGMYARVAFTVEQRQNALVVPRNAIVDLDGKRGVFLAPDGTTSKFQPISTGLEEGELTEVTTGLQEGDHVITTGAAGLRDGDRILLAGERGGPADRGGAGGGRGRSEGTRGRAAGRGDAPGPQ